MIISQEAAKRQINNEVTCGDTAETPSGRKTELHPKLNVKLPFANDIAEMASIFLKHTKYSYTIYKINKNYTGSQEWTI